MKKILYYVLLQAVCINTHAQEKRLFVYKNKAIPFLFYNNRMLGGVIFPGMDVYIIVGGHGTNAKQTFDKDEYRKLTPAGMSDYTWFYYIGSNEFITDSCFGSFLLHFIAYNFDNDFFNRNKVHLILVDANENLQCQTLKALKDIVASVTIFADSKMKGCDAKMNRQGSVHDIWQHNKSLKTSVVYPVPTLDEMELKNAKRQQAESEKMLSIWKGNIVFQMTVGSHNIASQYRCGFDTSTLVDFSKLRTLWTFNIGYHITNWVSFNVNGGFIYSGKKKQIDSVSWGNGITVSGSGYAGAIMKYGIGLKLMPYHSKRVSPFAGVDAGALTAIAGGGKGTKTIGNGGGGNSNITKAKEHTTYWSLSTGLDYRANRTIYFTGNIQYTISSFSKPIGSVNAFTGASINFGIGLSFSTKTTKTNIE
jgi:hypothetical protein